MTLQELNNDPRFARLSYEKQTQARSLVAFQEAQALPGFLDATPQVQQEVLCRLTYSAPVLESPNQEQLDLLEKAERFKAGDTEAGEELARTLNVETFTNQLIIAQAFDKLFGEEEGYFTNPEMQTLEGRREVRRDRDKLTAYLDYTLSSDARTADSYKRWQTAATVGGFVADLVSTWAVGGALAKGVGLTAKTGAFTLGKNTSALAQKVSAAGGTTGRFTRWFAKEAVPELIENSFFAGTQISKDAMRDGWISAYEETNPDTGRVALDVGRTFGEYFLMDFAFFAGLSTLRVAGSLGYRMAKAPVEKGSELFGKAKPSGDVSALYKFMREKSPEELSRMTPEARADWLSQVKKLSTIENVADVDLTAREVVEAKLYSAGIDIQDPAISPRKDLFRVYDWTTGKEYYLKDYDSVVKKTGELLDARGDLPVGSVADAPAAKAELRLEERVTLDVTEFQSDPKFVARVLTPGSDGTIPTNQVKFGVNSMLKNTGVPASKSSKIRYKKVDDFFTNPRKVDGTNTIYIPSKIDNIKQQGEFNKYLFGKMKAIGGEDVGKFSDRVRVQTGTITDMGNTPVWAQRIGSKFGKVENMSNGTVRFIDNTGTTLEFPSSREFGVYVFEKYGLSEESTDAFRYLKSDLYEKKGIVLTKSEDGKVKVIEPVGSKKVISKYNSTQDMLNKHPDWVPKVPSSLYPEFTILGNAKSPKLEVVNNILTGTPQQIREFSSSFTKLDNIPKNKIISNSNGRIDVKGSRYIVTRQDVNITKEFTSISEAKKMLDLSVKQFEDLEAMAFEKGLRVEFHNGQYFVNGGTDYVKVSNSLEGAVNLVKEAPMMEYLAKELVQYDMKGVADYLSARGIELKDGTLGVEVSLQELQSKINDKYRKDGTGFVSTMERVIGDTGSWVRDVALEIGDERMFEVYEGLSKARRAWNADKQKYTNIYHKLVGSRSDKDARAIGRVLQGETDPAMWAQRYAEQNGGKVLSEADRLAMERTREFLDRMKYVLGMDIYESITNYFPRIMRPENIQEIRDVGFDAWVHANFSNGVPKELSFWAENSRVIGDDEILELAREANIFKVIDTYIDRGFRKKHLQPEIDKANEWLESWKGKATPENKTAIEGMVVYVNEMAGKDMTRDITSTHAIMKSFVRSAERFMRDKLKLPKEQAARLASNMEKLYGSAGGIMINNLMAFRAWLPMRNALQPMSHLAPWVGMDAVGEAYEYVAKNYDKAKATLARTGRRSEISPIQQLIADQRKAIPILDKINAVGMAAYSESDIVTRMVVDRVFRKSMDENITLFQKGLISQTEFMSRTWIDKMPELNQKQVLGMLNENYLGAVEAVGDYWTDLTMFSYNKADNPMITKGFLGNLFSSFGTYPIHTVNNMYRMVAKNKDAASVLGAVTTAAAWIAGSKLIFEEVFGINADAFNITGNLGFNGGPQYQLLMTALTAVGGTEYEKAQAREMFPKQFADLYVPGTRFGKVLDNIKDGVDAGDYARIVRAAITAPEVNN